MIKLLGIQIAGGYSSEARVFASLLGYRGDLYDALILHEESAADADSPKRFERDSRATLKCLDFGWRQSPAGGHAIAAKVGQYTKLRSTLPQAIRIAREYQPDIVYSNQQHWDCYVATAIAKALGKPQIIHLHYIIGPWLRRQPLQRLLNCDHVVTVSDFIRVEAIQYGVAPERVTAVRNAMAPFPSPPAGTRDAVRTELGIPLDAPLIGIIARLAEGKGQDDTIEAFSKIARRYDGARLMIVGDGEIRPALEEQSKRLGVQQRVLFTGTRADVPRLLAALDIFCHPSRKDPCPLALLEAGAAGLPVIAYAEGGACEIVADGQTGILAPAGEVGALAAALSTMIENPDEARRMGCAGRERTVREFQPSVAGDAFAGVLRKVAPR